MSIWTDHVEKWRACTACDLCNQRELIVLARGTVPCDVLFIGEAPGESENLIGQPFVGPAGKLLDEIIARSVPDTLRYALTNLVACFPQEAKDAGINEPTKKEIEACRPRLSEFVGKIAKPRLVVTVGTLARTYTPTAVVKSAVPRPSYAHITHPAAILRMPMVQKDFAIQKCIVILTCAIEELTK